MFGHKLADVKGQALTCDVMSSQVYFGVPHGDRILESGYKYAEILWLLTIAP